MVDKKAIKRYKTRRDQRLRKRGFRFDVEWEEQKHPRDESGRFTSGGFSMVEGPKGSKEFIKGYIVKNPEIKKEIPKYKGVLDRVRNFQKDNPDAENGTYDAVTGKKIDVNDGYCVTFHQNNKIGDEFGGYDDDDYAAMCAIAVKELGADGANIGYFGNPEISFNCKNKKKALEFAKKHNQHSIYDAAKDEVIETGVWDERTNPIKGLGSNK